MQKNIYKVASKRENFGNKEFPMNKEFIEDKTNQYHR